MATPQPLQRPAKPPKLRFDNTCGPQPNVASKFRNQRDFVRMYRAYQWTQGYDLKVGFEDATSVRLICDTYGNCPFNTTAEYTIFTEPPVEGQPGYRIATAENAFRPTHNHAAPYLPMNVAVENDRRSRLQHDDPTLDKPPLVAVQGFAGSAGSGTTSQLNGFAGSGGGGAAGSLPLGFASAGTPSVAGTANAGLGIDALFSTNGAVRFAPAENQFHHGGNAAASTSSYSPAPTASHAGGGVAPTATTVMATASLAASQSPSLGGMTSLPPSHQQQNPHELPQTALTQFMLDIDPRFKSYFQYFGDVLPLDTDPRDLLELDNGSIADATDHTVFNMFRDISQLPLFLVALAADGIRKAKIRLEKNPGNPTLNPRIAVGLDKARAEKWVRDKIREGEAILAQRQQQAAAGAAAQGTST